LQRGGLARARSLAQQTDAVNQHIVSWMALTSGAGRLSSADVETTMQTLHDWPGQCRMRARYEEALVHERPSTGSVLQAFAGVAPSTVAGMVLYAKALQAS